MNPINNPKRQYYAALLTNLKIVPAEYKRAAAIGFYRQGATFSQIGRIVGIDSSMVESIIIEYFKKRKCPTTNQ